VSEAIAQPGVPGAGCVYGLAVVRRPPRGKLALACVVKRTYDLRPGRLALADEQALLVGVHERGRERSDGSAVLIDDTDLCAPKVATDVVLFGTAYVGAPGAPVTEGFVALAVGDMAKRLRVTGERRARVTHDGRVRFSGAEPFESAPLDWSSAYGGYDAHAHAALEPIPDDGTPKVLRLNSAPYAYPRNEDGLGYFIDIDRARADDARLPRIEDPGDELTPERFFSPRPWDWVDQPIAAGFGWVDLGSFPRVARLFGRLLPPLTPKRALRESAFRDGEDLAKVSTTPDGEVHPRSLQGASAGLACERLRGDELVILHNVHRDWRELQFHLPGEAPRLAVRPPGLKAFNPSPVLQTVRIEPDAGRVSLVWCAALPLMSEPDEEFVLETQAEITWARV
jgi:hypothetical protein